jgi:hypothetical protein
VPSRAISACDDTVIEQIVAKNGCSVPGKSLQKNRSIHPLPNTPGGRLIP